MKNADDDDDIDLIVITTTNRLWLSRFMLYLIAPILGIKRRKPREKMVKDKICFNLFLDENHLKINPQSLFLAHEICQIQPILNKSKTYEKFLWENRWVEKYLPNAITVNNVAMKQCNNRSFIVFLENLAFKLQYQYMKHKITCERVNRYQAFFHPVNLQGKIEEEFEQRLRKS